MLVSLLSLVPVPAFSTVPELRVDRSTPTFSAPAARSADEDAASTGREVGIQPFTTIGFDLGGQEPTEPVRLRTRSDGQWSGWVELDVHDDHGPDPTTAEAVEEQLTEPVWVDEADGYEIRLPAGVDTSAVEAVLVRETGRDVAVTIDEDEAGAGSIGPSIHRRSEWGARSFNGTPEEATRLNLSFVHHAVSTNSYGPGDVPSILRSIQNFHMDGQGWFDIAYNFAIDKYGGIWEARQGGVERAIIGGHTKGFNTGSTGVVLLGDYSTASPTAAMLDSLERLLGWKLQMHDVEPNTLVTVTSLGGDIYPEGARVTLNTVSGHRDAGATGCPGGYVYDRMGSIRSGTVAEANRYAGLGSSVWDDLDGDGAYESGEPPLVGVTVRLSQDTDGNGSYETSVATRRTNWNGAFWFGGLSAGRYEARVAASDLPDGYVFTNSGRRTWQLSTGGTARPSKIGAWIPADHAFRYGQSGDRPVVGDWDGDGIDTVGVQRGANFYLSNDLGSGAADHVFTFGQSGDRPVVGDWNADGIDTIGVRRGNTFYLRNSNNSGRANTTFAFGRSTDTPLAGDWDGDGDDTIGVHRGRVFYLRYGLSGGAADKAISYGNKGDRPVVGDWDGDGDDTLGVYRSVSFYLRNSLSAGAADVAPPLGPAGAAAFSGAWEGGASGIGTFYRSHWRLNSVEL